MNNQLLDETDKYTGPRTCPNCGHQYPFWKFVRHYLRAFILAYSGLSRWPCQACSVTVKCDFINIQAMWMLGLFVAGGIFAVCIPYVGAGWHNVLFILPYFAFLLLTLYFVRFKEESTEA